MKTRLLPALLSMAVLVGCDDDGQSKDTAVDVQTGGVSTACLIDLPEPSVKTGSAIPSLTVSNFTYSFEEDRHRYSHDRRFKDAGGVGFYIYRGKVCVEDAEVCADACVRYRVDAGSSLTQHGHHVATPLSQDRITLQYWLRDDAGNLFTLEQEIRTDGTTATAVIK